MPKKRSALRIKAARQKVKRHAPAVFTESLRIPHRGERVIVGDKIKRFSLGLQRNSRLHHAEIITDVQRAAGLDTRKDAHGLICHPERSRRISFCTRQCCAAYFREIPRLRSE